MIDSKQGEAFLAVAEHHSFSSAATQLSITLAAVSARIRALESRLGQRLLVRGKQVVVTPAGQALQAHLLQVQAMETDLHVALAGGQGSKQVWRSVAIAVNADSLASWFLPTVEATLQRHRILLDVLMDDQDHTHAWLKAGEVSGCVTSLATPLRGCTAEPLGRMRYRCVASVQAVEQLRAGRTGGATRAGMQRLPAIIFNRKDSLQNAFLRQQFGAKPLDFPKHFLPTNDAYEQALERHWGWGMVSEQQLALRGVHRPQLVDVVEGAWLDVPLYWHHWEREAQAARRLTRAVTEGARAVLRQD